MADNNSLPNLHVLGNGFLEAMGSAELLTGVSTAKPKHPNYAVEARRLQSFNTWPLWALQSPENLAKAGFYYIGFGDRVKCFYCDGSLNGWKIEDSPWEEHARWYKKCKYLLDVKGQEFVEEIRAKYDEGTQTTSLTAIPSAASGSISTGFSLLHPSVQLVKSLGYSEKQVMAALDHFYPQHQTGVMPKGAELLDAVLKMDEETPGARPATCNAGSSLPTRGRLETASGSATVQLAAGPPRPLESASVQTPLTRQREPEGVNKPSSSAQSSRALSDVKRQSAPPLSERALVPLHDIISTGLIDILDREARYIEENKQLHKHLQCKRCQQRKSEIVLLPCGHFSSCLECVPSLQNCPVCSTAVRGTIRTYLC